MTPHAQLRRPPTAPGSICVCWVQPVVGTRFGPFARRDGTARRTGQRQDVDRRGGREIGAERDGVQSRRQEHRRGQGRLCQRHARHPETAPHRACAGGAFLHSPIRAWKRRRPRSTRRRFDALAANFDTARQAGDDAELLHTIGGMATLGVDFQTASTACTTCSTATASTTASTAARGCSRPPTTTTFAVFQNYPLYPHLSVFENIAFPLRPAGQALRRGDPQARQRPRRHAGVAGASRPQAVTALRRPAPAGRDGPGHRPAGRRVPVRRTAVQPRRQAARPDAHRDPAVAAPTRRHYRIRHP